MSEPAVSPDQFHRRPASGAGVDTVEPRSSRCTRRRRSCPQGSRSRCSRSGATSAQATAATRWIPGTLFLIGLLATTVIALRRAALPGRLTLAALGLLAAFTVWSFLSIAWAGMPGEAWNGANRTLLYLVVFALFAVLPWTLRSARIAAASYALGVTVVAAAALYKVADTASPELFVGGRLAYPTGYPNANAALFITGLWAALAVAPRRDVTPLLRAALLGGATLLAGTALLSQSRGALVAVPATAVVAIAIVPGRVRLAAALVPPTATVVLGWDRILDVFPAAENRAQLDAAFVPAGRWIAVSSAVAAALGLAWALVDRRIELAPRTATWIGRGAAIGALVAVVAGTVAVNSAIDLRQRTRHGWDQFTAVTELQGGRTSNFGGLGTNRWDFWRVGMDRLHRAAAAGHRRRQLRRRLPARPRSSEEPSTRTASRCGYSRSSASSEPLLLAGALAAAAAAALLTPRRRDRETRAMAAGALVVCVYWLAHGSIDWFWEIPALGAPAFAFLGLAAALGERRPLAAPVPDPHRSPARGSGPSCCSASAPPAPSRHGGVRVPRPTLAGRARRGARARVVAH